MLRSLLLTATCALALAVCAPGRAQDSPSLGDIARQAQKDKANKAPAKVITNDDMSGGSGGVSSVPGIGPAQGAGKPGVAQNPAQEVDQMETKLNQLDAMDRHALAASILGADSSSKFPGRDKWEEKLFAAKQAYVIQSRDVVLKMRQLIAASGSIKNMDDPNDPMVKNLAIRLNLVAQENQKASDSFKAVIDEGKSLVADQGCD